MISAAMLVMKGVQLEEFRGLIDARTIRRIKADLKKLGIVGNVVDMQIPKPRIDYLDYKIFFKQFH